MVGLLHRITDALGLKVTVAVSHVYHGTYKHFRWNITPLMQMQVVFLLKIKAKAKLIINLGEYVYQ